MNLIKKGVALSVGDLDRDVGAVKSVLKTHYHWLMYVFMFHASSDVSATNAAYMGWLTYSALLDLAGITDENQRGCKQVPEDEVFSYAGVCFKVACAISPSIGFLSIVVDSSPLKLTLRKDTSM